VSIKFVSSDLRAIGVDSDRDHGSGIRMSRSLLAAGTKYRFHLDFIPPFQIFRGRKCMRLPLAATMRVEAYRFCRVEARNLTMNLLLTSIIVSNLGSAVVSLVPCGC